MPYLEIKGRKLYYAVKGHGPRITILRGLSRSSAFWLGFDKMLAKSFQVLTIDHRGLGKTSLKMRWTDSVKDISSDIVKVWDDLNWDDSHVFGLSFGGMVAMELAASYPERVSSLIVANSSTKETGFDRVYPHALMRLVLGPSVDFHRRLLNLVTTDVFFEKYADKYLALWQKILADEGFPKVTTTKQLLAASRFQIQGRIDTKKVPTLILSSGNDQFVPSKNSKALHEIIIGSSFKLIPDAGHEISMGRETETIDIIETWISKQV